MRSSLVGTVFLWLAGSPYSVEVSRISPMYDSPARFAVKASYHYNISLRPKLQAMPTFVGDRAGAQRHCAAIGMRCEQSHESQ